MKRLKFLSTALALTLLLAVPAQAQLNGSHTPGDYGVQSGSQPSPGFYAALFYLRYDTDTIKDADGNTIRPAPNSPQAWLPDAGPNTRTPRSRNVARFACTAAFDHIC